MSTRISRRHFLRTTAAAVASAPLIAQGAANEGFEIGLVADAQYADIESTTARFYRKSIARLTEAV